MAEEISIPGGYSGKIARVDLTSETVAIVEMPAAFYRKYLGGAGFINYFVLKEVSPKTGPLDAENLLVFANGPLSGLRFPGSARHCVGSISPLTGGIAKSEAGGDWNAHLKKAGLDCVVITGKAKDPVYLWIHDGSVEIRPAGHIWGQRTRETQESIRSELDNRKVSVGMIGPAGENQVIFACIMHGLKDAAGRGGLGAVMGSKNLKAVAVYGEQAAHVADEEGISRLRKWMTSNLSMLAPLKDLGTTPAIPRYAEIADLPVNNFRDTSFPAADRISAQFIKETIRVKMDGCYACPVRCKKVVDFEGYDSAYGGPEMETIAALGSDCGISDIKAISSAHALCNALSLDTISTGATIAFAMECAESGLLPSDEYGALEFGDSETVMRAIEDIGYKRGALGKLLSQGSRLAAEQIGGEALSYAMHNKGQEIPMHSPRANPAGAVGYAVGSEGADHCNNFIDIAYSKYISSSEVTVSEAFPLGYADSLPYFELSPQRIGLLRIVKLKRYLLDSLVTCLFFPYSINQYVEVLNSVTGWNSSSFELLRIAERTANMAQLINTRRGFSSKDDVLPERFFQAIHDGPWKGRQPLNQDDFESAKQYYYTLMGWDKDANPDPIRLAELGISTSENQEG